MRTTGLAGSIICTALFLGCEWSGKPMADESELNARIVESIRDTGINNAIITQHTLFPYHFILNGRELNELGNRDLDVLAVHYRNHPGELSVRRGSATAELYRSRLGLVRDALVKAGVDVDRITMADAMPGGRGMSSEQVIHITEGRNSPTVPLYYSGQQGSARGGMGQSGQSSGISSGKP